MLSASGMMPIYARANARAGLETHRWNRAAFEAKTLPNLMLALHSPLPTESKDVLLIGPDIAENGAVVPVRVSARLPDVRRLLVLVEKNPSLLAAVFDVSAQIEADFALRIKMRETSDVYAVAITEDDRVMFSRKAITVILGGCG